MHLSRPSGHVNGTIGEHGLAFLEFPGVTFTSTLYYKLKAQGFLLLTFTSKFVTVFVHIDCAK